MWLFTRGYYWSIIQNYPNLPQKGFHMGTGPYVMESILFEIHKRVKNRDRSGTNRFCCDVYVPMITRVSCVFLLRYRRCFHHLSAYGVAQDLKLENICFCEKSPSSTHVKAVLENPAAALASTLLWLVVLAYHHMVIYGVMSRDVWDMKESNPVTMHLLFPVSPVSQSMQDFLLQNW